MGDYCLLGVSHQVHPVPRLALCRWPVRVLSIEFHFGAPSLRQVFQPMPIAECGVWPSWLLGRGAGGPHFRARASWLLFRVVLFSRWWWVPSSETDQLVRADRGPRSSLFECLLTPLFKLCINFGAVSGSSWPYRLDSGWSCCGSTRSTTIHGRHTSTWLGSLSRRWPFQLPRLLCDVRAGPHFTAAAVLCDQHRPCGADALAIGCGMCKSPCCRDKCHGCNQLLLMPGWPAEGPWWTVMCAINPPSQRQPQWGVHPRVDWGISGESARGQAYAISHKVGLAYPHDRRHAGRRWPAGARRRNAAVPDLSRRHPRGSRRRTFVAELPTPAARAQPRDACPCGPVVVVLVCTAWLLIGGLSCCRPDYGQRGLCSKA